jgi:hypothetical protein
VAVGVCEVFCPLEEEIAANAPATFTMDKDAIIKATINFFFIPSSLDPLRFTDVPGRDQ